METPERFCLKAAIAEINPAVLEGQAPTYSQAEAIERAGIKTSGAAVRGRQLHPLNATITCVETSAGCRFDCRFSRRPSILGGCLLESAVEPPATD